MFTYQKIFIAAVLSLISLPAFSAESPCEPWPNCEEIGFKYSATECGTLEKMKCPFDETDTWYFCSVDTECPSGYVSADSSCPSGQSFNLSSATAAGLKVCYSCTDASCPQDYSTMMPEIEYRYEDVSQQYASDGQTLCYKRETKCNDNDVITYYENLSKLLQNTYQECQGTCRENANCNTLYYGYYNDECLLQLIDMDRVDESGNPYDDCLTYTGILIEELENYNTDCNKKLPWPNINSRCEKGVNDSGQEFAL